ncbi:ABC transporter substrate-binding protein [Marinifilum caeruleilacunae]|uniref:Iron ABC transporter substrate-binding protein n=1 Tax=Marinifilum caeruleilacunae TaxID=2499076 RepID=A0ABX1X0Q8_9BACT|nr:ABC transporter substrate-binding protein [Marinifilum caeruleilacunae]NOU61791.1 iron ABC transporter substrate-binding protein [Marinifilum caeruleilacunae]
MNLFKSYYLGLCAASILLFSSCNSTSSKSQTEQQAVHSLADSAFYYKANVKYAKGFQITHLQKGLKELIVWDPWNPGKVFQKYYLKNRGEEVKNIPGDALLVEVPVKSIAALSSTQVGILKFLGVEDKIVAVSLPDRIYDEEIDQKFKEGKIQAVGHSETLNFEKIVEIDPDLVMVAGFMKITDRETKLMQAGLPVAYNIEWMESSPLARAEWAKFIAAFFNKEAEANQHFDEVEAKYIDLKKLVKDVKTGPSILSGYNFKGTWYMPGGQSYLAQFLRDGKADYCWFSDSTSGSMPLSFETVFDKQHDADIWFGPGQCKTIKDLENLDERYTLFEAYKTKQVYCYTKRMKESGANDWFESGVMQPDIVFKDIIKILHPDLLPDYELHFYQKLK